jgi:hypothetical protein
MEDLERLCRRKLGKNLYVYEACILPLCVPFVEVTNGVILQGGEGADG